MTPPLRIVFAVGFALTSALILSSPSSAAESNNDEVEGSPLLKNFDVQQDIHTSPITKQDFIARLGTPKLSKVEDGVETVTWYYQRYDRKEELGEYVSLEANFNLAGVYAGSSSRHSGTLNLDGYLKKHLTAQERGVAPPIAPRPETAADAIVVPFEYKRVSFEEFFGGELTSAPLSFEIPKAYVRAGAFTPAGPPGISTPALFTVWLRASDVAPAVASHRLPEAGGFMHGQRPPETVASYYAQDDKFRDEDDIEATFAQRHMMVLQKKRFTVQGHPVFAYLARNPYGVLFGSLSVATGKEISVIGITYRPAATDSPATVRATWDHILASLQ